MWYIFVIVGIWILCGFAAGSVAKDKGYGGEWYVIGFLLGLIGIIIALCLTDQNKKPAMLASNDNTQINQETWKCPKCGKTNKLDNLFCPECGEKYEIEYRINEVPWICGKCNTLNEPNSKFCKKCGTDRATSEIEADKQEARKRYVEEHGVVCQMCDKKSLDSYNVKIVDSMGTRFRKVCPDCLKKYNCTIIPEKK